jgi:hypothetical protein
MKRINRKKSSSQKLFGILLIISIFCISINTAQAQESINYQLRINKGLLRLYDEFDSLPDKNVPIFKYECISTGLTQLREKYQLDKVAGKEDDLSKTLNLMQWLNGHVSHRGDFASALPDVYEKLPKNALGILEYSFNKGQDKGINCYMLAITFTELCLSVGLKSRVVSLNPMNPYDYDNHLVTMVWIENLSKWVMFDPQYNAYLRDTEGNYLNPLEVRDLLCRNKTIIVNDGLTYNGAKYDTAKYINYLAKNLFYIQTPSFTGFNSISTSQESWVALIPKYFDACKREAYRMKWLQDGNNNGNWEKSELNKLLKSWRNEPPFIGTSSISSFFQKPK